MSLQKALKVDVYDTSGVAKDDLALILNGVVDNIQTSAVSEAIKNRDGSGK